MKIWKISFSRDSARADTPENLHYCLSHGIVAVSRSKEDEIAGHTPYWEDLEQFEEYRDYPSELYALFSQIRGQDLVWTRDHLGVYFLGRVLETSSYRFRKGGKIPPYLQYPCRWFRVGTIEAVSHTIVDAFFPYRKLRHIGNPDANLFSRLVYSEQDSEFHYPILSDSPGPSSDVMAEGLFNREDLVDIIALYLQQVHQYRLIPSSLTGDTGVFDFTMMTGSESVSGGVKIHLENDPLDGEDFSSFHGPIYVYSPYSDVVGLVPPNMHVLTSADIRAFLNRYRSSLPPRIGYQVRYYLKTVPDETKESGDSK